VEEYIAPKRKTKWISIAFFSVLTIGGVIGAPLYIVRHGVSPVEWALFGFYFIATGMAITVGYHRLFSHATYKTNALVRFLLLFFGAATFEESALKWASQHRQHHQFTDTDKDPHNTKRGLFYCHIGWIMFYRHRVIYENVKDLQQNKLIMNQHDFYDAWSVISGIVIPMAIGWWIGRPLGVFLISICLRMTLVLNAAFLINSYAHMIGKQTFDKNLSARDHWFGAVVTNGEGYHSFHHKFPNDYRNGYRWYHWDPSKWCIYLLSRLGLVWDLKRTSPAKILDAIKLAA